jgi:uncharacterized protein YkwD
MVRAAAGTDDLSMRRVTHLTVLAAAVALVTLIGFAGPAAAATTASQEARVVKLVNAARAKAGCAPLKVNAKLTKAARAHSADMAKRHYFAHNTPGGTTPWTRIAQAGYPKASLAENIAAGQPTADAVVKDWLNSPPHRQNILDCRLRSVGTGLVTGGTYRYYWTQDFGSK